MNGEKVRMAMLKRFRFYLCAIILCIVVFLGCENSPQMKNPKETLKQVAQDYWHKRLLKRDYEYSYNLEQEKEALPFKEYLKRVHNMGKIDYLSVRIDEIKMDEDRADVKVMVLSRLSPVPKDVELAIRDKWVIESGEWKHVLSKK